MARSRTARPEARAGAAPAARTGRAAAATGAAARRARKSSAGTTRPATEAPASGGVRTRARKRVAASGRAESIGEGALTLVAGQLRSAAEQLIEWGGRAADLTLGVGGAMLTDPQRKAALARVGKSLRAARESVGMTIDEVSQAVDLSDPALLVLAEQGKAALPFEVLLRLAAVLARNDPIAFALRIMREHDPGVWKAMHAVGVDRLAVHAGREYEFLKLYRTRDAARELSDAQFARVLQFLGAALDLALTLHAEPRRRR